MTEDRLPVFTRITLEANKVTGRGLASAEVDNVGPLERPPHAQTTRIVWFQPAAILVIYSYRFGAWMIEKVLVSGYRLRTGQRRSTRNCEMQWKYDNLRHAPEWVRSFAIRNRPGFF